MPPHIVRTLYFSLIYPHLTHGICAWGASSLAIINKMQSLQNKILKLMPGYRLPNFFKIQNILTFQSIYKLFVALTFFKYVNSSTDSSIRLFVNQQRPAHDYGTRFRGSGNINLPLCRTTKFRNSFIFKAIAIWNEIPPRIKNLDSICSFKRQYNTFLICSQG